MPLVQFTRQLMMGTFRGNLRTTRENFKCQQNFRSFYTISGCPIDCVVNDYHLYSTPSQLYLGDQDEFFEGEKHGDEIVHSAIHFFYPSFSYTVIKNHPQRLLKWLGI
jgi:hypothetical protein